MGIFYFDNTLLAYEANFQWDQSLKYLERLFLERKDAKILYSLIGFSWFYLIEGPVISKKYANDPNVMPKDIWKKYIDVGAIEACNDPFYYFIAGYTLSLHGFHIDEEYEKKGNQFMKTCLSLADNVLLQEMAENFLVNEHSRRPHRHIFVKDGESICKQFFNGKSLLDKYFNRIYY